MRVTLTASSFGLVYLSQFTFTVFDVFNLFTNLGITHLNLSTTTHNIWKYNAAIKSIIKKSTATALEAITFWTGGGGESVWTGCSIPASTYCSTPNSHGRFANSYNRLQYTKQSQQVSVHQTVTTSCSTPNSHNRLQYPKQSRQVAVHQTVTTGCSITNSHNRLQYTKESEQFVVHKTVKPGCSASNRLNYTKQVTSN